MLEAANWAPTHGRTEPWRYTVLGQEGMQAFADLTLEVCYKPWPALHRGMFKYGNWPSTMAAGRA